jgi:hypothetical protein
VVGGKKGDSLCNSQYSREAEGQWDCPGRSVDPACIVSLSGRDSQRKQGVRSLPATQIGRVHSRQNVACAKAQR